MEEVEHVECSTHGRKVAASVCGHLVRNNGLALGFVENSSDPNDLQGWCFACEHLFLQEQDKTERFRSFCQHSVVCSACYEAIKSAHWVPAGA